MQVTPLVVIGAAWIPAGRLGARTIRKVSPLVVIAAIAAAPAAARGDSLDLRLTLSSFLFRETGGDGAPLVAGGAAVEAASPVRRYFGDLRLELSDGGLRFDGRVRQTTSLRYQAGAGAGGEYELRALGYQLGRGATRLTVGRQHVDAAGAIKIDGAALARRLTARWTATVFGGALPALGSRSLATDYPAIRSAGGAPGAPLVPLTGGLAASYRTPAVHGDVGVAAVHVAQDVPGAPPHEASRVVATASGYARPAAWLDVYHFARVDLAGARGAAVSNGSLGLTAHPAASVQLSGSFHHVSADVLEIAARNLLADPDPDAIGVVQNDVALVRVSQDVARAGASVALARARFELSLSGGYRRRPAVEVALAGGGALAFPAATTADVVLAAVDRRSLGGLRVAATATLSLPLAGAPNRARGGIVRLAAGRALAGGRAELTADVMAERFREAGGAPMCTGSLDPLGCFSASSTAAAQLGALASYRVGREWLVIADAHAGAQDVDARGPAGPIAYPRIYSLTAFARVQWRYR